MIDFINDYLTPVYSDFLQSESLNDLCELKSFYFDGTDVPDYTNPLIQQYYLLKFAPAYIWEYKRLYDYAYIKNSFHKIYSFGCGAGLDLAGQYLSLKKNLTSVDYKGLDLVDWNYKPFPVSTNINYAVNDIDSISKETLKDRNILFFPKSLSEFSDSKFNHLFDAIQNTNFIEPEICLIISSTDSKDEPRFESIVKGFISRGYIYKFSEYDGFYNWKNESPSKGIKSIDYCFDYPDEIKEHLNNLTSMCLKKNCADNSCNIDIWPVLTTKNMYFAHTILVKN